RDYKVTGVQTCALPISAPSTPSTPTYFPTRTLLWQPKGGSATAAIACASAARRCGASNFKPHSRNAEYSDARHAASTSPSATARSEERRVGKGGRRRAP